MLQCRIKPRSSRTDWGTVDENEAVLRLTAPPVDGKANAALKKYLAKAFGTAASRIEILKGETRARKILCIRQAKQIPDVLKPHLDRS